MKHGGQAEKKGMENKKPKKPKKKKEKNGGVCAGVEKRGGEGGGEGGG